MVNMPVIRVSGDVQAALQRHGKMGDTYETVLRRLLKLPPAAGIRVGGRVRRRSDVTPRAAYVKLIPEVLRDLGGAAATSAVLAELRKRLNGRLTDADLERLGNGQPYWQNSAEWARKMLVAQGVLLPKEKSGRGTWKLA